jgi:hypothetical protein
MTEPTSRPEILIWEAGQSWAAALRQLCHRNFSIAVTSQYEEICRLAAQCPYAVSLWEVNLSNWEDRARRLCHFRRNHPSAGVAIATKGVPDEVQELFCELGVKMILKDRLSGMPLLRSLDRLRQVESSAATNWREHVTIKLPWIENVRGTRC